MIQQKTNKSLPVLAGLIAVVGIVASQYLKESVPKHEGVVLKGYLDPIGIPTKCMGDTNNVIVGKIYTEQECWFSLETQLINHAKGVLKCVPEIKNKPEILAASVSFAYNFGVYTFCQSSIALNFKQADFKTGCKRFNENALGKPQYIFVKDKYNIVNKKWIYKSLPGLVKRRADERALCEKGL